MYLSKTAIARFPSICSNTHRTFIACVCIIWAVRFIKLADPSCDHNAYTRHVTHHIFHAKKQKTKSIVQQITSRNNVTSFINKIIELLAFYWNVTNKIRRVHRSQMLICIAYHIKMGNIAIFRFHNSSNCMISLV